MRIGLTYDLRDDYLAAGYSAEETAEFDSAATINAIEEALQSLGHQTDRIGHAKALVKRLAAGDRWELVFNICEGMYGTAREAQVPALLDVFDIPYTFSDPLVTAVCLHKGLTKTIVRQASVPTPDFLLVERLSDLDRLTLSFPLFAKPVAEGTGKGVTPASKIRDAASLRTTCAELLDRYHQPVLVEQYLSGREFTAGILGTGPTAEVIGTLEIILRSQAEPEVYSYINKERCEELVEYRLVRNSDPEVRAAEEIALAAYCALGCRDSGRVDLRSDGHGRPHFLEVNPIAGLNPGHSDLPMLCAAVGLSYRELIERIVTSAAERVRQQWTDVSEGHSHNGWPSRPAAGLRPQQETAPPALIHD